MFTDLLIYTRVLRVCYMSASLILLGAGELTQLHTLTRRQDVNVNELTSLYKLTIAYSAVLQKIP